MTASARWEHSSNSSIACLGAREGAIAILCEDATLGFFAAAGENTGAVQLPAGKMPATEGGASVACLLPCKDGWFAGVVGDCALLRHENGKTVPFAAGHESIVAAASSGEQIAIVRRNCVELWTLADRRRWRLDGGPFVGVVIGGNFVAALREDGELVSVALGKGSVVGSLKLASEKSAASWRLAPVDGTRIAMSLGDWLVVVDLSNQKVLRRTRARSEVVSLAANAKRVVAGLKDGWLQAFDAFTGDARAAVCAHEGPVSAVAIGNGTLFTAAQREPLRAWEQAAIEEGARTAAPVTALATRGAFVAVGDRSGRLRLLKGVEEVGSLRLDGAIGAAYVGAQDSVVAAAGAVLVCLTKPWKIPRAILLAAASTALAVDGAYAFSGTEQGSVEVIDLESGKPITTYALSEGAITALLRLPTAHLIVGTGALDGRLFVVDVAQAKVVFRVEAHQDAFGITCLAAEPRGRLVASGSDDGTIALIDPSKGRVLARVRVGETPTSMAFDSSGRKLAVVLADGSSVIVAIDRKAAVIPLERSSPARASHVAWADSLVVALADGKLERPAPAATS